MAETVVDLLEVIYIDHQQREDAAMTPYETHFLLEHPPEQVTVGGSGQGIPGSGLLCLPVAQRVVERARKV